jgi:hypothetical protein
MDSLMYTLAEGKSRGRGTRSGGVEPESRWGNIIITTGEEPITGDSSGGGAKNRAIEIYCRDDLFEDAAKVAGTVSGTYGHAGQVYISGLTGVIKEKGVAQIRSIYDFLRTFFAACTDSGGKPFTKVYTDKQLTALALMGAADYYASQFVFGIAEQKAMSEATEFTYELSGELTTAAEVDQIVRAYDFLNGWIASNAEKFCTEVRAERYGVREYNEETGTNWVYIIAPIFKTALEKAGFNARKIVQGLLEQSLIEREGEEHITHKKQIGGDRPRCYKMKQV